MIDRPLIVVGTGRCGSTLLHRLLVRHPNACYLTPVCTRWPARPELNHAMMRAIPVLGGIVGARRLTDPSESYPFWEHYCPGFSEPSRDLTADDLLPADASAVRDAFERMLTPRRDRLVIKITGWPRVGYLDLMLTDARFVHIRRDGRAVANSFLNEPWWGGWEGPERWRWGELTPDQEARWQRADRSPVALAALTWEVLMDAFDVARTGVPSDRYLDLTYEELCANPVSVTRKVAHLARLEWTPRFEQAVASIGVRNANDDWRAKLTPEQQEVLVRTIEPALARHGYS